MTSRERLLAAYRHAPVDRVPCSPRVWAWLLANYGSDSIETNLDFADRFDYDPHFVVSIFEHTSEKDFREKYSLPNADYRFEERREGDYRVVRRTFETPKGPLMDETRFPPQGDRRYGIGPNPVRTEHLVKSRDDLEKLPYLITDKRAADFTRFRNAEEQVGERGLVMLGITSALTHRAADVYPMEELMMAFHLDRSLFDALMELYQREMMEEVRLGIENGVRHFYANWYYNSLSAGWSPRIWKEVFAPQLREMTSAIHKAAGTVNYYDDGKCMGIVELLAECGIDVLQTLTPPPVGDVDLAEVKRRIGARVCLMGYVDLLYVIQRGTPKQIDQAVKEAIETGAPGGGFILGTSDSIRDGTPFENVQAYFEAAQKYGRGRPA
jgi:uroporphyrinogen-III decarboxylase